MWRLICVLSATASTAVATTETATTTTVAFTLEPLGSGTKLTLNESGHTTSPKDLEALVDCAAGWGEALTLLKFYLEHGTTYGDVP